MAQSPFLVPPFASACLEHARPAWAASFEHPFVLALADGTLAPESFKFYQMQDARYLEAFADAAAIIATRCEAPQAKLWFVEAARIALVVEADLHAGYGQKLGYGPEDIRALELSPNNRAYQDHMVSAALRGSLVEAIAALTPCPWLYVALGQHLLGRLGSIPDTHPYAAWLRMYSDPSFNDFMAGLLGHLEDAARGTDQRGRDRAQEAFLASVRYEWMFWEQAHTQQRWPV